MFQKRILPVMIAVAGSAGSVQAQEYQLLEEIVVQGVQRAELNAREAERDKDIFSSVISQDDSGNFADQNVAESLQRLPGVTLQKSEGEGRFVTVRGLGPGFVTVSMNGSELASSSSDTRAFALDAVPADLLSSIEVFKSLTPDMDLNSIGGTVNVKTISPFDRKSSSLRMGAQLAYQEFADDISPKVFVQGTNLFANDTFGIGYSLSHEKRFTEVYETRHHPEDLPRYLQQRVSGDPMPGRDATRMLAPWQFEHREEQAERTRTAGSLDLGWRPDSNSDYYVRLSHTSFKDVDVALREYYRTDPAQISESEIAFVDPATNTFGVIDAELQQQLFIQEGTAETTAFSIGGENVIDNTWTLDYNYAHSIGKYDQPDGRRVQFRLQDVPMIVTSGRNNYSARIVSPAELAETAGVDESALAANRTGGWASYEDGERVQPNLVYDNLFIEDSFREDTIDELSLNLRRDFDAGIVNYVKTGFTLRERERDRSKDRWSVVPSAYPTACGDDAICEDLRISTLGDFATSRPDHSLFAYDAITQSEAERLLAATSQVAKYTDPDLTGQETRKDDYLLTEDSAAAYVMAEFQLTGSSTLIAGVRYEQTDVTSSGYFTVRNDRFTGSQAENSSHDVAIPVAAKDASYSNLFPSLHYRYELAEDILVRASLWTSFARPAFDQTRAFGEIVGRVSLCNPLTNVCSDNPTNNGGTREEDGTIVAGNGDSFYLAEDNTLRLGNPNLEAMRATNFDASVSWYGQAGDFAQAAFFYKDIKDFIVEVRGASLGLDELPLELPFNEITQFAVLPDTEFSRVNYATNGDKAKVYGVELSYSKYFNTDYFVQTNVTLMQSDAKVGDTVREGSIRLPDQADSTVNLTLGWENDYVTLRMIGNYRSKVLNRIGGCSTDDIAADLADANGGTVYAENCKKWADVYQNDSLTVDFKATYEVTDSLRLSFDAINLTDQKDRQYFEGNEYSNGQMLYMSEEYGRSFQLGVNYRFK